MLKQLGLTDPKSRSPSILRLAYEYSLHSLAEREIVRAFFASLNTPVSLSCLILYDAGEFEQLVSRELDPGQYNDPIKFRDDFAAVNFLRKNSSLKTTIDTKAVALQTFIEGEENCKRTNSSLPQRLRNSKNVTDLSVYAIQVGKIARWLGRYDVHDHLDACRWGPGVSTSVKGDDTSACRKFDIERFITQDAYNLFGSLMPSFYHSSWENLSNLEICPGNVVVTVPKNAKTDRTIAIEPGINLWLQLGAGALLRRKLRYASYDLNSDFKNRQGAFLGSRNGKLATIDFRAASDSISNSLVELLLPREWFLVLDAIRSKRYTLDKKSYTWSEKFSTMGNGFTFELESLIFVTLAESVCDFLGLATSDIAVFGDDLIVPVECVEVLIEVCGSWGFRINRKKSFSSGYFRESCGSYYFNGLDVKPFYYKAQARSLKDVYRLLNSIKTLAHRFSFEEGLDLRFKRIYNILLHELPPRLRLFGPLSAGDAVIASSLDESKSRKPKHQIEGFLFIGLPSVPITTSKDSPGLLLARLRSTSRESEISFGNSVPLRGRTRMVLKKNMFAHRWYNFGSWIS